MCRLGEKGDCKIDYSDQGRKIVLHFSLHNALVKCDSARVAAISDRVDRHTLTPSRQKRDNQQEFSLCPLPPLILHATDRVSSGPSRVQYLTCFRFHSAIQSAITPEACHSELTHIWLITLEVGKLLMRSRGGQLTLRGQRLLSPHRRLRLPRHQGPVEADAPLGHGGPPHRRVSLPGFLAAVDSLVLLGNGLVWRREGVGLQQRPLVTLLVSRADGVRSVCHRRPGHSLRKEIA